MGLIRSQSCQTSTNQHPQGDSEIWRFHLGEESREIRKWSKPALSTASAWLCKRICNHNLPLYGLGMGNNAFTFTNWASLAFKIVLNFPRASRTPQAHITWSELPNRGRESVCFPPPTFLLCNDSITSSHVTTTSQSEPGMMRYWPIRDQHCTGIISPRLTDTALDLITLARF